MYQFTFIPSIGSSCYLALKAGDIIELKTEADNKVDKNAVAGYISGEHIGYLANSPETLLDGSRSATSLNKQIASHRVKKVVGILKEESTFKNKLGELQRRFLGEAFFVPNRSEVKSEKTVLTYIVGGTHAQNTKKNAIRGEMIKLAESGEKIDIPVIVKLLDMGDSISYKVYLSDSETIGASAGEIINPDDDLMDAFRKSTTLQANAVSIEDSNSYRINIRPNVQKIEDYYPCIDAAIEQCIDQANTLEEKVMLMLQQNVPELVIKDILKQMPVGQSIEQPKTTFYQTNGSYLADLLSYMLLSKPVRLVGGKGTGKNTLIETACWLMKRPFYRMQGNPELDKSDLQGSKYLDNGSTGTELSAVLTTLQNDGVVVIDEVNAVPPGILLMLNSLTDKSRAINVEGCGMVKMGEHACIIYTMNENYLGTEEMNAATLDRVPGIFLETETDFGALLRHIVPDASEANIELCVKVFQDIEKLIDDGRLTDEARTTRGYIDALEMNRYIPIKRGLIENVANKAQSSADRTAMMLVIENLCG